MLGSAARPAARVLRGLPPKPPARIPQPPDEQHEQLWRLRYRSAIVKLRGAGIETADDEAAGEEQYVAMRREWDRYILAFTEYFMYTREEVDPAGVAAAKSAEPRLSLSRYSGRGQGEGDFGSAGASPSLRL